MAANVTEEHLKSCISLTPWQRLACLLKVALKESGRGVSCAAVTNQGDSRRGFQGPCLRLLGRVRPQTPPGGLAGGLRYWVVGSGYHARPAGGEPRFSSNRRLAPTTQNNTDTRSLRFFSWINCCHAAAAAAAAAAASGSRELEGATPDAAPALAAGGAFVGWSLCTGRCARL
ncbi:hypothetical protein E2C01_014951 [Portunus trituberculatus]|uniref:Uncharacterized protein n=1 Tax=Portunus trituberculatus TaxID=210409 RepID=A0A5B7DLE7_PORTR|nr:hypothetical protein [Portunus trituberculatus]